MERRVSRLWRMHFGECCTRERQLIDVSPQGNGIVIEEMNVDTPKNADKTRVTIQDLKISIPIWWTSNLHWLEWCRRGHWPGAVRVTSMAKMQM